jgi:hypothetical protein
MTWPNYLAGQRLFVAGDEQTPRRAAWNLASGFSVAWNPSTNMWDITATGGGGGGGTGDVVGPASSVDGRLALFDGTTGELLKQGSFLEADLIKRNGGTVYTANQSLGNNSLTAVKSISLNSEIDNGNSSTADTIDWTAGAAQKSTLTGNVTYTFTAPTANTGVQLRLIQDGVGGRTVTWPPAVTWLSGSAPAIASGAAEVTIVGFWYDGTTYWGAAAGGSGGGGSSLTAPADPADDGKVAIASGGDLSYALLANANVAAGAAIAGSKITPDFGAQTILTTGGLRLGAVPAPSGSIRFANDYNVAWADSTGLIAITGIRVTGADIVQLGSASYPAQVLGSTVTLGNAADTWIAIDQAGNSIVFGTGGTARFTIPGTFTALQQLRVNAGGTALEYFSPPTPVVGADLTNANATKNISDGSQFTLPAATLASSTKTLTLGTSGTPEVDEVVEVIVYSQSQDYVLANGGPIADTIYTVTAGTKRVLHAKWNGTDWRPAGKIRLT